MNGHVLLVAETDEHDANQNAAHHALFNSHIPRVIPIAVALHRKLPVGVLCEEQDFIMVGLKALWDCATKYETVRAASFWTYAQPRVSGSMLDELRAVDHASRSFRALSKEIEFRQQELEQQLQREVSLKEVCVSLGLDINKVRKQYTEASINFVSLDSSPTDVYGDESTMTLAEAIADTRISDPALLIDKISDGIEIEKLLDRLKPLQRSVVRLYFFSGLRLHDIAKALRLTESRVSQILNRAIEKLRQLITRQKSALLQ